MSDQIFYVPDDNAAVDDWLGRPPRLIVAAVNLKSFSQVQREINEACIYCGASTKNGPCLREGCR